MATIQQFPNEFRFHTPEGDISISPLDLAKDLGVAGVPIMPAGFDQRVYEQGKCHALKLECSVLDGGPMPWPEGDSLLREVPKLLELRQQRHQEKLDALETEYQEMLERSRAEQQKLAEEAEAFRIKTLEEANK